MLSNRLAFAALAVACIAAAAGGGYLASRQNAVPAPASAQTAAAQPSAPTATPPATASTPPSAAPAPTPVPETEALVGDTRPSAAPAPAPRKAEKEKPRDAAAPKSARAAT